MNHKQAHLRLDKASILEGFGLLTFCIVFQIVAITSSNDWLKAIALRVYYLPVLYTAIKGGMVSGIIVSIVSIFSHLAVMFLLQNPQNALGHDQYSLIEHVIEMPFLVIAALLTGILRDHYLLINEEKNKIQNTFERYVSPSISKQILNDEILLEGELLEATMLFCDIRDFTQISETATPRQILALLNLYFSEMTEILLDQGAFIDKFIGDSVMAVFGVPIADNKSAQSAVRSAIQMKEKLHELNAKNVFGDHQLDISIGLHTGPLVAGLLGSNKRQDYTVIGDTVNLASRIESLNRMYHSHILISDTTKSQIEPSSDILIREVDSVRVKGRNAPTVIYEIFNICGDRIRNLKQQTLADFSSGMAFYKAGYWVKANQFFNQVLNVYKNDPISKLYLDRIQSLKDKSIMDWDGVFSLNEK